MFSAVEEERNRQTDSFSEYIDSKTICTDIQKTNAGLCKKLCIDECLKLIETCVLLSVVRKS